MLDIRELMNLKEAYAEVYAPKELTEEQVWEGVETWVHSLLEEGYDLSDYTWEEMYETYLEEGPYSVDSVKAAQQAAQAGQAKRDAAAAKLKAERRSQDVSDYRKAMRPVKISADRPVSKFAGARDAAIEKAKNIKGSPVVGSGNVTRPTATPTATAPRPAASPAATGPKTTTPTAPTKPAGSAMDQFAAANPKLAAAQAEKDRIRGTSQSDNPLMKDMKDRMPMTPSVQSPTLAKDLGTGSGNQSLLDNPDANKSPEKPKQKPIVSGFDMFDVVKGYLIGEGYADTEEAALVIMANMSEDWKYSIMESMLDFLPKTKTVISNKPEDKRNPLQKYSDATKPLFAGLPQGKTVTQKPQPRGREFTNPPS